MNNTPERQMDSEYVFKNGKWTKIIKPLSTASDGCTPNRSKEMTDEQVSTGVTDTLVSPNICSEQTESSLTPYRQEDVNCSADEGVNISNTALSPSQSHTLVSGTISDYLSSVQELTSTGSSDTPENCTNESISSTLFIATPAQTATSELNISDMTPVHIAFAENYDIGSLSRAPHNSITEDDKAESCYTDCKMNNQDSGIAEDIVTQSGFVEHKSTVEFLCVVPREDNVTCDSFDSNLLVQVLQSSESEDPPSVYVDHSLKDRATNTTSDTQITVQKPDQSETVEFNREIQTEGNSSGSDFPDQISDMERNRKNNNTFERVSFNQPVSTRKTEPDVAEQTAINANLDTKIDGIVDCVMADHKLDTNATMDEMPKNLVIQVPCIIQETDTTRYGLASCMSDAPTLTQTFPQLDVLELKVKIMENNSDFPTPSQPMAVQNDTGEDGMISDNYDTNFQNQTHQNYNVEKESDVIVHTRIGCYFETQFPFNSSLTQSEISYSTNIAENNVTEGKSDTQALIPDFQEPVREVPQINEKGGKAQSQMGHNDTPVACEDLGNSSTDTEGFSLTQADVKSNCEVSNELWLDACQFLPGEEDRELIFDEWGHSPTRNSPDYTKGSNFPWDTTTAIGQSTSDSKLWRPPVERWSSSDSWASALSDWFQSVTVLPEGFISTTVAGDSSQSKSNMAIQDQVGEQRPYTESGKYSGQMCFLNTDARKPGVDKAQTTTVSQGDNPIGQLSALGDEESSEESCFTLHLETGNTKVATKTHDMETTERAGLSGLHASEIKSVLDVPDEKMPSLLPNNEKSAKQPYLCIEQQKPKPECDAFGKVTEDSVSQLQLDSKEEGERSYGSLKLSDYPSSQALPPGCVCACGEEQQHATDGLNLALHTRSQQFNKYVSTETGHLTHTRGPETDEGGSHAISSAHEHGSYVCFCPEELHVNQAEESSEAPQFVMPFAPLSFGNSYFHYADKASEKDQACVGSSRQGQPPESWAHDFSEKATPLTLQGTYHRAFFKPICDGTTHESKEIHEQQSLADRSGKSTSSGYSYISKSLDPYSPSSCRDLDKDISEGKQKVESEEAGNINNELSKLILLSGECFLVSAKERIAYVTLDLDNTDLGVHLGAQHEKEILPPLKAAEIDTQKQSPENKYTNISKMPHKTSKSSSESKTRSKHKDKSAGHQLASQTSKKQENLSPESQARGENKAGGEDETVAVIETIVITEKITTKPHGKKKKKHGQHVTVKPDNEPLKEVENGARPKSTQGKIEGFEAKLAPKSGKTNEKTTAALSSKKEALNTYSMQKACAVKAKVEVGSDTTGEKTTCSPEPNTMCPDTNLDDDIIKKRRIEEKSGTITIRTKPQLPEFSIHLKKEETTCKKAYSEVVKQKPNAQREAPRVVQEIQAAPVPGDPQSISLWCEISSASGDASIKWTKEGAVLSETKRGAGENGSISLTILKVCSKDLGIYQCCLSSPQGSVTTDYHLTSEVLSELVIPVQKPAEPTAVDGAEENVQCAPLLFKDDFLCQQYFGEKQPASILTEKVHFGEGMHRKAFRTTLRDGMLSVFTPGHPCVLKVHNAISYGTKNNDELVQKNYNLAVEECYVQNTAREYIKAYNDVAKSAEAFGEVPEIIPIYLVHRPSNDIPYATLEEELIGDFVKYSVKDGKEINLMRRDSEAGQKCCAFQHWVYQKTEGNLLVTDMQGVGMKLTDVGIATGKKGYKGFRGNCGTSFIDQFKALHQCNRFCELLGLTSLQPKPKRTVAPPKQKAPSAPKKKTFNPVLKGKS